MKLATLMISLGLAATLAIAANGQAACDHTNATLRVSGHGEVWVPPDRAVVRLGVTAQAETASQAQSNVNATIARAIQAIEELDLRKGAIRTVGLQLSPVHASQKPGRETDSPRIVGYRASNTIQVTIDDLPKSGRVIDAAIQAGANQLQSISFQVKDELPHKTEALKRAVDNAETKAKAIAGAADVNLRRVQQISEGGATIMQETDYMRAAALAATPVEPGELRANGSVTILYELTE